MNAFLHLRRFLAQFVPAISLLSKFQNVKILHEFNKYTLDFKAV
jgi:hypothetical protein